MIDTKLPDELADFSSPFNRHVLISPYQAIELIDRFVRDDRGIFGIRESVRRMDSHVSGGGGCSS